MAKDPLILHICCAPCAATVINRLKSEYEIIGLFYNPNIFPEEEYKKRLFALEKLREFYKIPIEVGRYDHQLFLNFINGLEDEPEGGRRCEVCYRLRLRETAIKARDGGYKFFATTLTVGPRKSAEVINKIGLELGTEYGVNFIPGDWKKRDGFKESVELSRKFGLYRQTYCGCEFS